MIYLACSKHKDETLKIYLTIIPQSLKHLKFLSKQVLTLKANLNLSIQRYNDAKHKV